MSQEHFTHGLTVKFPPSLHAELSAASEREGVSCGHIIRRALRAELDGLTSHALDPYVALPPGEVEAHLVEAIGASSDPEASEVLVSKIGDEITDLLDATFQALDVLHDPSAHQQLERVSGYLRQADQSLLLAASRTKALRVGRAVSDGELERIEARLRAEGYPEDRDQ